MKINELLQKSPIAKIDKNTQLSNWAISKISGYSLGKIDRVYQNSTILRKLMKFSKIFTDVKVSIITKDSIFRFPLTPSQINVNGNDLIIDEFDTIKGKINRINDISLMQISFNSFFPSQYYPFSDDYTNFGVTCVNKINSLKYQKTKVKLVITGIGIVLDCYISKFSPNTSNDGDIEYSIEFTEAKDPSIYEDNSYNYTFKPKILDFTK